MNRRWLPRALTGLAVPALLVPLLAGPILAGPASAATRPPAVPTLAQVVAVYPSLKGGDVDVSKDTPRYAGPGCTDGKKVAGAAGRDATYTPTFDASAEGYGVTGSSPMVDVTAERFPSAAVAKKYFSAGLAQFKRCAKKGQDGLKVQHLSKIRVSLGDQRLGYRATATVAGLGRVRLNFIVVRDGRVVVSVFTISMTRTAPSVPAAVEVTRLALRTAR